MTDIQLEAAIESGRTLLVLYRTSFCNACQHIEARLTDLIPALAADMDIATIYIDFYSGAAAPLEISSSPTVVLYENGKPVSTMRGFEASNAFLTILSTRARQ